MGLCSFFNSNSKASRAVPPCPFGIAPNLSVGEPSDGCREGGMSMRSNRSWMSSTVVDAGILAHASVDYIRKVARVGLLISWIERGMAEQGNGAAVRDGLHTAQRPGRNYETGATTSSTPSSSKITPACFRRTFRNIAFSLWRPSPEGDQSGRAVKLGRTSSRGHPRQRVTPPG